jgi:hypothetical protein
MKKLLIIIPVLLVFAVAFSADVVDKLDVSGGGPNLPQPGEWAVWDDNSYESGWTWYYFYCDNVYDGWGKLTMDTSGWGFSYLTVEGINAFEMCHSSEPGGQVTGFSEDWAICADDMGYPSDFMDGSPWFRDTFPNTWVTPGVWETYTVTGCPDVASGDEFWLCVVILQDHWTPGGYNSTYYGYDTASWYGRSYAMLHNYYDWEQTIGILGQGEWMFRVYGDGVGAIEDTSIGHIKNLFQ